jgi:hypothetical protein
MLDRFHADMDTLKWKHGCTIVKSFDVLFTLEFLNNEANAYNKFIAHQQPPNVTANLPESFSFMIWVLTFLL